MTKVNPNNGNDKNKLDVFPWDIFKADAIPFLSENNKILPWHSKSRLFSFMTKVIPNNRNERK